MAADPRSEEFRADLEQFVVDAQEWLTSDDAARTSDQVITTEVPLPPVVPTPKPRLMEREPVLIAQAITVILGAFVTTGWLVLPSDVVMTVGTVVAFIVSGVMAVAARARVAPVNTSWFDVASSALGDLIRSEIETHDRAVRSALNAR